MNHGIKRTRSRNQNSDGNGIHREVAGRYADRDRRAQANEEARPSERKMKLAQAEQIAQSLKADLEPFCEKIEIGGSIRRKKPEPNDIEFICIPKFGDHQTGQMSLEGDPLTSYENLLFEHIAANSDRFGIIKMGEKYAQIEVIAFDEYIKVDVFTATKITWGYIFMLRTGPAEFSKWVVTELKRKGYKPEGGEISHGTFVASTPTEQSVFNLLDIDWIEPEYRFKEVMWK